MFTRSLIVLACAVFAGSIAHASAELDHDLQPRLGKPAPEGFESVVMPDGSGAPEGKGTVAEGKVLYTRHCSACHGAGGKITGNAIAGGRGTLTTAQPNKTVGSYWPFVTTLYDYINRAMPYGNEKSLSADDVYAVTAYVLFLNGIIDAQTTLTRENLAQIKMPNRNGFVASPDYQPAQ